MSLLGSIGGVLGGIFGGPTGSAIGGAIGSILGGNGNGGGAAPVGGPVFRVGAPRMFPVGQVMTPKPLPPMRPPVAAPGVPARTATGVVRAPPRGLARISQADAQARIARARLVNTPFGVLPRIGRAVGEAMGWVLMGIYFYDLVKGVVIAVKTSPRTMNPLNHRALRRSIRRVKSATKICREVERITHSRSRSRSRSRGSASAEAACR